VDLIIRVGLTVTTVLLGTIIADPSKMHLTAIRKDIVSRRVYMHVIPLVGVDECVFYYFLSFCLSRISHAIVRTWPCVLVQTLNMDPIELDAAMSESSTPSDSSTPQPHTSQQKRSAADAGLKTNGARPNKSVKRRASKACQCCRARKVRCNVVEHGAPCTNCRLDEVECVVSESKRKKYGIRKVLV